MSILNSLASALWRVALAALLAILSYTAWHTGHQAQRTIASWERPADRLAAAIDSAPRVADAADRQATEYRRTLERQIAASRAALIAELRPVTQQAAQTLSAYRGLPQALQPTLDAASATVAAVGPMLAHADKLVVDIRPQALGLVAGWKVVGGEAATTMRDWQRATPTLIQGVNRIVANSDRTTDATAGVMANFREATKPLPRWMRIGLGVAPPMAQTAAGAATAFALTGR